VKVLAVLDRIFGIVVPLCMIACVILLWLYLSCPCSSAPVPFRLRIEPKARPEQRPPKARWVDARAPRGEDIPAAWPSHGAGEVNEKRSESAEPPFFAAASQIRGNPQESSQAGQSRVYGARSLRASGPGERRRRSYSGCARQRWLMS